MSPQQIPPGCDHINHVVQHRCQHECLSYRLFNHERYVSFRVIAIVGDLKVGCLYSVFCSCGHFALSLPSWRPIIKKRCFQLSTFRTSPLLLPNVAHTPPLNVDKCFDLKDTCANLSTHIHSTVEHADRLSVHTAVQCIPCTIVRRPFPHESSNQKKIHCLWVAPSSCAWLLRCYVIV